MYKLIRTFTQKERVLLFTVCFTLIALFAVILFMPEENQPQGLAVYGQNTINGTIIQANAACLYLPEEKILLYDKNSEQKLAPASTVKLLTALVAVDYCQWEEKVTVGTEIELINRNSSRAWLYEGDVLTFRQLLYAMLLPSGNDAAYTVAAFCGRKIASVQDCAENGVIDTFDSEINGATDNSITDDKQKDKEEAQSSQSIEQAQSTNNQEIQILGDDILYYQSEDSRENTNNSESATEGQNISDKEAIALFVEEMNKKAYELGAFDSCFLTPDGFDENGQYTTAYDLALIAAAFCQNEELLKIAGTYESKEIWPQGREAVYYNTNELLNPESPYYYERALGLKTGTSSRAGACLISAENTDEGLMIAVILGSSEDGRYSDCLALFNSF